MKKIFLFLTLAFSMVFMPSCDSLLEELPDNLNEDIDTVDELKGYLVDGYKNTLGGGAIGGQSSVNAILMSDLLDATSVAQFESELYNFKMTIFNTSGTGPFYSYYNTVQRANTVLELADAIAGSEANNLKGQAYFLRGLAFFNLVRFYAHQYGYTPQNTHLGIPLVLDAAATSQPRSTVQQTYDQIISDLNKAISLLPTAQGVRSNAGFASAWSAKGLLARVYLQMNNYAKAYEFSNDVIENGGFVLEPTVMKDFTLNGATNPATARFRQDGSTEGIFVSWGNITDNLTGTLQGRFRTDTGDPSFKLKASTVAALNSTQDARKAWYNEKNAEWRLTKFDQYNFLVYPIIHLTEMKLIRAEAAGRTNANLSKATADLQQILNRAYGNGIINAPTAAADIVATALSERAKEMVGEGEELFTFKRLGALGTGVTMRNARWDCHGTVLLFPRDELDTNPYIDENNPSADCF